MNFKSNLYVLLFYLYILIALPSLLVIIPWQMIARRKVKSIEKKQYHRIYAEPVKI